MTGPPKTSSVALRPYQRLALEAIREGWREARSLLVVAPTGSGKTVIFSHVAAGEVGRVLILAHREELLAQARASLKKFVGIAAALEKAEAVASLKARVVVSSVQTMARRLSRYPRDHFSLVIVDEAHHSAASTYERILGRFSGARVLGVTATPSRSDEKDLAGIFHKEAYRIGLPDLIRDGYLARLVVDTLPLKIDLSGVSVRRGDFSEEEAGHALEPYLEQLAGILARDYATRRILAFLPLRATSKAFVEACNVAGMRAAHIDGESEDRADILQRFAEGSLQLVSNAMLLTEGFDCPSVDAVLLLRPTRSRVLYAQMVGRGTRIHPGKENCLILDPCFIHARLPLRASALIAKTEEEEAAIDEVMERGEADLLDAQEEARELREERERALADRLKDHRAQIVADYLTLALAEETDYQPVLSWEAAPPSDRQIDCLTKAGFDASLISSRGLASKLIDGIGKRAKQGLATIKQVRLLRRFGVKRADTLSFAEAGRIIGARLRKRKGAWI